MTANPKPEALAGLVARERDAFIAARPLSRQLVEAMADHWHNGVPHHWMRDWPTPFPIVVDQARGATIVDVDGHAYADFCLGDTGAMTGHAPEAVMTALNTTPGFTAMLPARQTADAGSLLAACFGMPFWQLTSNASEANRSALRWARAITGRSSILVFDGCYHGAVDDCFVTLDATGQVRPRDGLIGQVHDMSATTRMVPFNDLAAVAAALADRQVAAVLTEPALTNCGMVLPEPGFLEGLRQATRDAGTLLIADETHTLSTAWGGMFRQCGIEADLLTLGKPIAGGLPAGAFGFSADVSGTMRDVHERAGGGYSGMGTTLAANMAVTRCIAAVLTHCLTPAAYVTMLATADRLEAGLNDLIARHRLGWRVVRLGARMEIIFATRAPGTGKEARALLDPALQSALQLFLINRGVLVTPFHMMLLVSPATGADHVERLLAAVDAFASFLAVHAVDA